MVERLRHSVVVATIHDAGTTIRGLGMALIESKASPSQPVEVMPGLMSALREASSIR